MLEFLSVVGTRPNFVKVAPVARALAADDSIRHRLIHTGQHYEANLSGDFFEDLEIRQPDLFLEAAGANAAETIGLVIARADAALREVRPDAVLILGDTK